jgi:hypothetical protein
MGLFGGLAINGRLYVLVSYETGEFSGESGLKSGESGRF